VYLQLQNVSSTRDLFSEKIPDVVLVYYVAVIPKPNYARLSLSAFIRFRLPLQAWMDIRRGQRETVSSGPPFCRDAAGTSWEFRT